MEVVRIRGGYSFPRVIIEGRMFLETWIAPATGERRSSGSFISHQSSRWQHSSKFYQVLHAIFLQIGHKEKYALLSYQTVLTHLVFSALVRFRLYFYTLWRAQFFIDQCSALFKHSNSFVYRWIIFRVLADQLLEY